MLETHVQFYHRMYIFENSYCYVRQFGLKPESISNDHKPSEPSEQQRIISGGGKVYQSNTVNPNILGGPALIGPVRVLPGRLSVSQKIVLHF